MMVNELSLGTAQWGMDYGITNLDGKVLESEVSHILSTAFSHGYHWLDTAQGYGDAEKVIGKLNMGRFKIINKIDSQQKKGS